MTDWFRSWHGAPTDNKWLLIGRRVGVAPGIVSAIWWAIMDHASQAIERGKVDDFDVETYAAFSGFDEGQISKVLEAFTDKKLILNGWLVSWEKRQPNKEDPSASERKRQQRSRDVTPCHDASRDVTTDKSRVEKNREEQSSVTNVTAAPAAVEASHSDKPEWWPKRDRYGRVVSDLTDKTVYDVGKVVLGTNSGGQITKLLKCYRHDLRSVADILLQADEKSDPKPWFSKVLKNAERDEMLVPQHEKYPDEIYRVEPAARAPPLSVVS